jgi:hypothetical protein
MSRLLPNNKKPSLLLVSLVFAIAAAAIVHSRPAHAAEFTVYKSPSCGCCANWVTHLRTNGHDVSTKNIENLDLIKKMAGVPEHLHSCHTAMVDGYIIEGHVPASDINRLLAERPKARGLSAPGMPSGSPGMEGGTPEKYNVMLFKTDGTETIFAKH